MKNELLRIFSLSRNERIGLVGITFIVAGILFWAMCSKEEHGTAITTPQPAIELATAIDSAKTDTVQKKQRKKIEEPQIHPIRLTVSNLEELPRNR